MGGISVFPRNKRFMRSVVDSEQVADNVKRFLCVLKRFMRFLSVLSVLDAFRREAGRRSDVATQRRWRGERTVKRPAACADW